MGRKSSIDKLPKQIRDQLNDYLRDNRLTQQDVADRTNALLEAMNVDHRVSRSAVNRYSMKMEQIGAKIRQSRQMAEHWIGSVGSVPQGEVGKLINEIIRTMAFETSVAMADSEDPVSPKMLKDLALAVQRLESAANMNEERERKIRALAREEALAEAAESIEAAQVSSGLTAEAA